MSYQVPVVRIQLVRENSLTCESKSIQSPFDAVEIMRPIMDGLDREAVYVMLLNTKNMALGINMVSMGDISSSIVHPREVFKAAILANAAGIVMFHNHPSGDTKPSLDDEVVSKRIYAAGEIIGISLLDHIIIGANNHTSLKDLGII